MQARWLQRVRHGMPRSTVRTARRRGAWRDQVRETQYWMISGGAVAADRRHAEGVTSFFISIFNFFFSSSSFNLLMINLFIIFFLLSDFISD
jgi:hypothetical protein